MSNRIHDMAEDERPREKLAKNGAATLSNAELLALFIATGTGKLNAIQIAQQMLKEHGSLAAMSRATIPMLKKQPGIGMAKACNLAAAFELGNRVAREQITSLPLDSPERVYDHYFQYFVREAREKVVVVPVDTRYRPLATEVVSSGTVNESTAHPREIFHPVITRAAYGFILIHNHPSGDPSPSRADESLTRRLAEGAALLQLRFLDHVIIGRPAPGRAAYFSFREGGLLD